MSRHGQDPFLSWCVCVHVCVCVFAPVPAFLRLFACVGSIYDVTHSYEVWLIIIKIRLSVGICV